MKVTITIDPDYFVGERNIRSIGRLIQHAFPDDCEIELWPPTSPKTDQILKDFMLSLKDLQDEGGPEEEVVVGSMFIAHDQAHQSSFILTAYSDGEIICPEV